MLLLLYILFSILIPSVQINIKTPQETNRRKQFACVLNQANFKQYFSTFTQGHGFFIRGKVRGLN